MTVSPCVLFENNARQRINENKTKSNKSNLLFRVVVEFFFVFLLTSSTITVVDPAAVHTSIMVRDQSARVRTTGKNATTTTITWRIKASQFERGTRRWKKKRRKNKNDTKKTHTRQKRSRSKQWPNSLNFVENDIVAYIFHSFSFQLFCRLHFAGICTRSVSMRARANNERQPTIRQQQQPTR